MITAIEKSVNQSLDKVDRLTKSVGANNVYLTIYTLLHYLWCGFFLFSLITLNPSGILYDGFFALITNYLRKTVAEDIENINKRIEIENENENEKYKILVRCRRDSDKTKN